MRVRTTDPVGGNGSIGEGYDGGGARRVWSRIWYRLTQAALCLALLAAMLTIPLDRSLGPARDKVHREGIGEWMWGALVRTQAGIDRLPRGVAPVLAVILLVLVAYAVHDRIPWLAWLVTALVLANGFLIVAELPAHLEGFPETAAAGATPSSPSPTPSPTSLPAAGHPGAVTWWVRALIVVLLVVLVAKLLLLFSHAIRSRARGHQYDPRVLLPSQNVDFEELKALIEEEGPRFRGRVLPIEGRWGEGKSFLVRRLKQEWDAFPSKPVVVIVDVWQQESDADLQAAILREVASHQAFLRGLAWMRVPASFLLASPIAALRRLRTTLKVRLLHGSGSAVEMDIDLPRLRWQTAFERLASHMAMKRKRRTVIVLDELDRATPPVTQAALTLARRSVDVPGVTVVIPYIQPLIRYKAFNPLIPVLPDLASSMASVIFQEVFSNDQRSGIAGTTREQASDSILDWWAFTSAQTQVPSGSRPGAPQGGERRSEPDTANEGQGTKTGETAGSAVAQLDRAIALGFASASKQTREALQARFEEKYLGHAALRLRPIEPSDLAGIVTHFPTMQRLVAAVQGSSIPGAFDSEEIARLIEAGSMALSGDLRQPTAPPIRVLEGRLYRVFDDVHEQLRTRLDRASRAFPGSLPPLEEPLFIREQEVAALALAALDLTGLVYST